MMLRAAGLPASHWRWPLAECWTFQARHAPRPAWGDPKVGPVEDILELRRVHFDDVFQTVGGNDALYFGSSADHKLYCLELATGALRWSKSTGGPIRLAPTLSEGRVYVGSDDGYVYCCDAKLGDEIWRFRAAPEDRRVLGHGKMISLWPSRTSVLVDGGAAYFGAGIFPAEGVFLYGVEASSGKLIWRNDATGENPQSRVSPQGYLVASPTMLYAPMGRVSPAAFRRTDGQMVYETSFGKQVGGSYTLLAGQHVYTGTEELVAFDQQSRDRFALFPGRRLIVGDKAYYLATGKELVALDRQQRTELWKVPCPSADELILAGTVLIAGGTGQVTAYDSETGKHLWQAGVEGAAKGLAVIDGRSAREYRSRIHHLLWTGRREPARKDHSSHGKRAVRAVSLSRDVCRGGREHSRDHAHQRRLLSGPRLRNGATGVGAGSTVEAHGLRGLQRCRKSGGGTESH